MPDAARSEVVEGLEGENVRNVEDEIGKMGIK